MGGGIGCVRILFFVFTGDSGLTWCLVLQFFSVSLILLLVVLGCLSIQQGLMRDSEKPDFPIFVVLGKGRPALRNSAWEVDGWLPLLPVFESARLTGDMLADVVLRKGATASSLDGWGWRELKGLAGCLV